MHDAGRELQRRMIAEALEQARREPPPPRPKPSPPKVIHYTELEEDLSDDPGAEGWNVYVREVGRLIAEGHEGKWVVIAEGRLIGVYDTEDEAHGVIVEGQFAWPSLFVRVSVQYQVMPLPFWYPLCRR